MKNFPYGYPAIVAMVIMGLVLASRVLAAQTPPAQTTAEEVKKKVAETVQAIKSYSVDQRNQAVQKAKVELEDFDARINELESRLNQKWDQMDGAARQEASSSMAALRKQRNAVAEWLGGLEHGSKHAWEDVKAGFSKSFHDLGDAFDKAYQNL
ncbi:MAG: hypothetical protein ACM3KE_21260 [Hyphomicrobiales bacterium]